MRSAQSPSIDFNQMLVVSVFFHFFLFTAFMFLPQTQDTVRRIKPAFTVSFVSIPTGSPDIQPAPQAKEAPVAPAPPKPSVAAEKPIPKPKVEKPIPKPIPIPKPKPVPEKSAASKALVSKLDELAKKTTPKKDKVAMVVPKPKDSFLDDFKKTKMQTEVKKKPVPKKNVKKVLTPEEKKFQELSKKSATQKSQKKTKKTSSLLKELDELEQMQQKTAALNKPKTNQASLKSSELVKRLEAIQKENSNITIDFSKLSSSQSRKFKSGLPNMKFPKAQKSSAAPAASGETGDPAATALSFYLGKAQILINEQWKNPAGGGSGKVQVSFKIFPNGKIENPKIKKSSGVSKLDNLALLAIKNAALPPFPKEIREPNLPFIIEFTYETKKR
jgi:TonB family protein